MGDYLDLESEQAPKNTKFSEIFDEAFPIYLSMGMTYDQFWNDRPELAIMYRKADKLNKKKKNQELWLQGVYVAHALSSTVGNMFIKNTSDHHKYPDEPLPLTMAEKLDKEERDRKARFDRMKAKMMVASQTINKGGD